MVASALSLYACGLGGADASAADAAALTGGGIAERGQLLIDSYGCDACHTIPGVPGADRTVGPPLAGLAGRLYLAGVLPNNPENLIRWILEPSSVDSLTAMPDLRLTEREARDVAAYLYTIR